MVRLSRSGWNNVLIFTSLIMIFLFNGLHLKMFSSDDKPVQQLNLLPADEMILTIDFPNYSLERIGRSWRTMPESDYSVEQLQVVVEQWQQLQVQPIDVMPNEANQYPDVVVSFWFAGQKQAFVVQIFKLANTTVLRTPNGLVQLNQPLEPLLL
ncbi:hypothetical protein [Catenovulum agarivorans]|uniref:hypothetical protein n=1 Tax=Catenovulum agarivorans TaxID=1172192 RepID=UPI000303E168|nr:hypothetical protein [Catenovulum agarivorans]